MRIARSVPVALAGFTLSIFLTAMLFPLAEASFSDVSNYRYKAAIDFIEARGIISGYSNGSFLPDRMVNRAEFIKMIIGPSSSPPPAQPCFPDVPTNQWFARPVCTAKVRGLINGYPNGLFQPGRAVNAAEAVVITQRAYELPIPASPTSVWYAGSWQSATASNIIPPDVLSADQVITRGQVAELLTRVITVKENNDETEVNAVHVRSADELRTAVSTATAGTTILLEDGTYTLDGSPIYTRTGGSASAPITIRAAHANAAIIETAGAEEAFSIDHPYYVFENLYVKVSGRGSYHAYKFNGDSRNSVIRGGTMEVFKGAESGVKGSGSGKAPYPDNILIEGTEIFFREPTDYTSAEGIDAIGVRGWTIRNNTIHGIQKTDRDSVAWGILIKGNSQDTVIEGNTFYDCDVAISIGGTTGDEWFRDDDTTYEHRNAVVRNNVSVGTRDVAVYIERGINTEIYNNTFVDSFESGGRSSIDVRYGESSASIHNNILDKPARDREGGTHTESSNVLLGDDYSRSDFVDIDDHDLHLKQGTELDLVATRARAGAFISGSTDSPPPPPPPPSGDSGSSSSLSFVREEGHGVPGMYSGSFGVADFDADGKIDLVMTGNLERRYDDSDKEGGSDRVRLYKNDSVRGGTIHFAFQSEIPNFTGTRGSTVEVGDFDGDGRTDFAVEMRNGSDIASFMNEGGWRFRRVTLADGFGNNSTSLGMKAVDIDRDGKDDLVFNSDGGVGAGLWYSWDVSGSGWEAQQRDFTHAITYGGTIAAGDLTGDSYPEIAVGGNSNRPFGSHDCSDNLMYGQVHKNLGGSRGFEKRALSVVSAFGLKVSEERRRDTSSCEGMDNAQMVIADIDTDGKNDVVIAGSSTGQNGVPERNGQQYDFTVLFNRDNSGNNFEIWENTGVQDDCGGTSNGGPGNVDQPNMAVADFTGDGLPDIFVQGHRRDYLLKWGSNCTKNSQPADPYIFENIIFNNNGNRTLTPIHLDDYLEKFSASENFPGVLNFLRGRERYVGEGGQAAADFNNDGAIDLIFSGAELPYHSNGVNEKDYNSPSTLQTHVLRNSLALWNRS